MESGFLTSWVEFICRKEATNRTGNKDGETALKVELRFGDTPASLLGESQEFSSSLRSKMVFNHERLQPRQGGMVWGKEMVTEALLPALPVQTSRWKLLGFA